MCWQQTKDMVKARSNSIKYKQRQFDSSAWMTCRRIPWLPYPVWFIISFCCLMLTLIGYMCLSAAEFSLFVFNHVLDPLLPGEKSLFIAKCVCLNLNLMKFVLVAEFHTIPHWICSQIHIFFWELIVACLRGWWVMISGTRAEQTPEALRDAPCFCCHWLGR